MNDQIGTTTFEYLVPKLPLEMVKHLQQLEMADTGKTTDDSCHWQLFVLPD
jgi:hypothetical protein